MELIYKKSSRSGANNNCVEVARAPTFISVRDSKNPHGVTLSFTHAMWVDFSQQIKTGRIS